MFSQTRSVARKFGAKIAVAAMSLGAMTMARAADADPISQMMDAVNLSGVSAKVVACGLLIVGIALAFKGPDLGKRVVKKV
ncbi:hypothetical protein QRO08_09995 [Paracidovorax citrulli]|uniref:Uncharacterized protein n=2 Tax=Paracidovorax citrulli TaxID=80869 RepID=A1TPU2_PARC0|nr:hypothetical protein [Paracidovorax citrulli]ABM32980.1 hypothetical protein Aave_2405 [Paracidovorax citrulli AAC00-1]ATG93057.1 hypothetical protein CQB05_02530 [Paracidovorax citrulli]PVY67203.1 hypothetical protein C8E08_4638 [Paracidovorax citrulli]REG68637.1 hypothetical protein C8E07_1754 [Paracidovorax citrulli]RLJ93192.1 hypothetical protein C8E06_1754 [Paracidovorax citrulli]